MLYDVIDAETIEKLISAVREKIADGWEPIGGVGIVSCEWWHVGAKGYREDGCVFIQAMTKEP